MTEEQAPRGLSDEELECRVDELRTYLGFSTCHTEDCARYQLGETKCDCGLPKFMGAVRDLILSHRALRAKVEELERLATEAEVADGPLSIARVDEPIYSALCTLSDMRRLVWEQLPLSNYEDVPEFVAERDTLREEVKLRKQEIKDRDATIRAAAAEVERLKADLERQSRLRGCADIGVMNEHALRQRAEEQNRALREEVERSHTAVDNLAAALISLSTEVERLDKGLKAEQDGEHFCIAHAAHTPQGDCFVCDTDQAEEQNRALWEAITDALEIGDRTMRVGDFDRVLGILRATLGEKP